MRLTGVLTRTPEGWWRLTPPAGLGRYLRHLYFLWAGLTTRLHAPMRGCHVTIAEAGNHPELEARLGLEFDFLVVLGEHGTNGNAVWIRVECESLAPFQQTKVQPHLCLGYFTQERTRHGE